MTYLFLKAAVSGVIIVLAAEAAKRSPALGALIVALPLTSILAMIWLWRDTHDALRVADLTQSTFWYVLPSLPMFLVLPALLRNSVTFWVALAISCGLTAILYLLMVWVLARFGISL